MENMQDVVSRRTLLKAGVWFSLFNSIFLLLLSFRYASFVPDEVFGNSRFYIYSLIISHFVFLAFVPFFFIYLPLTILTKNKRKSMIIASVSMTLALIVFLIDSYVFSLYRFHLNKYVFEQMAGPGAGQVFELSIFIYMLAVFILVVAVLLEILIFRASYKLAISTDVRYLYGLCGFFILIGLSAQITHAYGAAKNDRSILGADRCFPLSSPLNANKLLESVGMMEKRPSLNLNFRNREYVYPKSRICSGKSETNILMIVLDSWGYRDCDSLVTPHIYEFSKKGVLYSHHYSGSNGTRGGIFSLFYGLPGVYWYDFMEQQIAPVFMRELKSQNYDVRLYPSASLRNPAFDKNAFSLCPDQCESASGSKAWERDLDLAHRFTSFVNARTKDSQPFFSLLFFDSLHSMIVPDGYEGPFQPSWSYPRYEALCSSTDPKEFRNLYRNMAYYVDSIVGSVLDNLEKTGVLENTVVVITGDHAQEFNENGKGFWGHNGNYSEAQVRVPLIYVNKKYSPSVCHHWTSHFDVVPTLMQDVFSVSNPISDYSIGRSLHDASPRPSMQVDSYIGFGIVDSVGNITNIYYDNTYDMLDENLKERMDVGMDTVLFRKTMEEMCSFYKEDALVDKK